jgi:tetratricopeptide (TPR) repeat protein
VTPQIARGDVFVGRARELEELSAGLEDARAGRGSVVLLSGEPGIGKSRLVDEFASRAREGGVLLLWGRCWEAGGAPAFWPWIQVLRSYLRGEDPDSVRAQIGSAAVDIAQMLPEIAELFPDLPPPPKVDPDSARFQLFDSTASFLLRAARREPLVLVLEDLHAADTPSLLLLQFLTNQVGDARLLVLGTYRDVELTPDHPLTAAVAELSREPPTRRIHLRGLVEDDVARFIAAATGVEPPPPLVSALHRETGGNPLFMGETVRLLAVEGRLDQLAEAATLRVVVPKGIRDVIGRRLDHLDDQTKHTLSLASVLGTEFTTETLRRLAQMKPDEILDIVDRAVQVGLVTPIAGAFGRFRFSHDLVRETLYGELTSAARIRLHERAAEVLLQVYATDEEPHLAELAHHFFEAAQLGKAATAVNYSRRAGDEAARSLAYEEAARLYRMAVRALELTEPVDHELLGELLLAEGEAQARAGDLATGRQTLLRAASIARRTGAATQLARTALEYGGRFIWARAGNDPHIIPMLQDALVLLGGSDDRLRVRLLARLACALRSSPDREHSAALSQQALDMAEKLGDPSTLCYALAGRFGAIWWPETPEERLEISRELIEVSERAQDIERILDGHWGMYMSLTDLGRISEAKGQADILVGYAEELRQPAQRWFTYAVRAQLALIEGDFEAVEGLVEESQRSRRAMEPRDDLSAARAHLFLLRRDQGRVQELEEAIQASILEFPWYPLFRSALMCLLLDIGRREQAQKMFDELTRNDFRVFYRDNEWLLGISLAAEACSTLGDASAAQNLYDELLPFRGRHAIGQAEGSVGAVDRYLGLLARTMGRLDDAERHFTEAIAFNEQMGARPWVAHSRCDLAELLLHRGGPGDRERATEELSTTRDICEELGMPVLTEKVAKLLMDEGIGRAGPPKPARPAGPSVLRKEGEYWTVVFDQDAFRLKDTKGLQYLAALLAAPGREFHVLDLVRTTSPEAARSGEPAEIRSRAHAFNGAGAVLDPQAKEAYRTRLSDLEADIEDAEALGDADRAERARSEREFIARELAAAVGLGGRDRLAVSVSERARVNVTRAVKATLARIADHSPALARHLEATVRTGTYCSYQPDPRVPVAWQL